QTDPFLPEHPLYHSGRFLLLADTTYNRDLAVGYLHGLLGRHYSWRAHGDTNTLALLSRLSAAIHYLAGGSHRWCRGTALTAPKAWYPCERPGYGACDRL